MGQGHDDRGSQNGIGILVMKSVYFLSDAHLGCRSIPHDRTRERRLVRFLDGIKHNASALYQYAVGSDDEDDTGYSIYEYTLNSAGDWQTKQYGRKALTKLVKKTMEGSVDSVDLPYVSRGDDGNLYALMQVKLYDENANPFGER